MSIKVCCSDLKKKKVHTGNKFHPLWSSFILIIRYDNVLNKGISCASNKYKTFKGFPCSHFKHADVCATSPHLPFKRITKYSWHNSLWFNCVKKTLFIYDMTTIGRKWAEVFFLLVFCPLFVVPLPFRATNICLPLCFQFKDAYVLYPFSSILSFNLQSLLNSFC